MTTIFGYLQQGFSAIVPFIILLGLLIFVHELGHFMVAKFFGVRVEVFSLGFGKKIFSMKRGDTTYAISLIPLGGYVKMFGDQIGADISEQDKQYSYLHKPVWQRIGVVLAGPLMNFFFAVLIFFVVAMTGEEVRGPVLGDISSETDAFKAGFRSGDTIVSVGDSAVNTWEDFQEKLTSFHGKEMKLVVKRETGGQLETLTAEPKLIENPNLLGLTSHVGEISGINGVSKQAVIGVRGGTFAAESGLKTGDRIAAINGHPVKYFRELENAFISMQGKEDFQLQVERIENTSGKETPKALTIPLKTGKFSSLDSLGIEGSELYLYRVLEGSPAEKAGLHSDDRVLKIDNLKPQRWEDILNTVKSYKGDGTIKFEIERGVEKRLIEVTPQMTSQMNQQMAEEKRFTVGIVPSIFVSAPVVINVKSSGIGEGLAKGWNKTWEVTGMTILSFVRLIQNKISPKNIGGVISIGQAASDTFKMGMSQFMQMMAIISVNLFILNLLPIPVLDGGHLVFYTIEAIKGAPLSLKKMEVAQQVGLVMLMSLMVFALFNDFTRLLGSW